ncbi:MAG: hypothetical protein ACRC2R_17905 [Xenococcaceae cyanobacterium]
MSIWIIDTFNLPLEQAREKAKDYFKRYPRFGYETHIYKWKIASDGKVYFEIRRLKSCD